MNKTSLTKFSIYLGMFINTMGITIIYPFGSLLVQEFDMASDRSSTGYWVGVLNFSFMAGRTISSPIWGQVCDKIGRRPVALLSSFSVIFISIMLGFSQNYWWALACRALFGLLCCLILVGRITIAELTNSDPESLAFSVIVCQIGDISGNIIGGIFVDPVGSGISNWSFLEKYPFLLPNFITSLCALLSFALYSLFLKETLKKTTEALNEGRTYQELFRDQKIVWVCLMYFVLLLNESGYYELFSLWCWADKKNGGFEMSPLEIGNILGISAIVLVLIEAPLYKFLRGKMEIVAMTRSSILIGAIIIVLMPVCSVFNETVYVKYFVMGGCSICWWIVCFINITNLNVMQNNCVINAERGKMNALFMVANSTSKAISPVVYGSLFAYTAQNGLGYPFNYAFVFNLMACVSVLLFILSLRKLINTLGRPLTKENIEMELLDD